MTTRKDKRRARFTRGAPLFKCNVCHRLTRNPDHSGTMLCAECYELAGLDNYVNDNGMVLDAKIVAERDALFADAVKHGGDGERIKKCCDYLWPDEDQFAIPADLSIPAFLKRAA